MTEHVIRPATDTDIRGRMLHELECQRDELEAKLEHGHDILDVAVAKLVDAMRRLERAETAANAATARLDALQAWEATGYNRESAEHTTYLDAMQDEKQALNTWRAGR